MKNFKIIILSVFIVICFVQCKGDPVCSPLSSPLEDMDGDCTENDGDNCILVSNPNQVDIDGDGVGDACDDDVSTSLTTTLKDFSPQTYENFFHDDEQSSSESHFVAKRSHTLCKSTYIVSCLDNFLGTLDAQNHSELSLLNSESVFGNQNDRQSLLHEENYFARPDSECSAFNSEALDPPALFCVTENNHHFLKAYITLNPDFKNRISPCELFPNHPQSLKMCQ